LHSLIEGMLKKKKPLPHNSGVIVAAPFGLPVPRDNKTVKAGRFSIFHAQDHSATKILYWVFQVVGGTC